MYKAAALIQYNPAAREPLTLKAGLSRRSPAKGQRQAALCPAATFSGQTLPEPAASEGCRSRAAAGAAGGGPAATAAFWPKIRHDPQPPPPLGARSARSRPSCRRPSPIRHRRSPTPFLPLHKARRGRAGGDMSSP